VIHLMKVFNWFLWYAVIGFSRYGGHFEPLRKKQCFLRFSIHGYRRFLVVYMVACVSMHMVTCMYMVACVEQRMYANYIQPKTCLFALQEYMFVLLRLHTPCLVGTLESL
jgi:hypothetical protein